MTTDEHINSPSDTTINTVTSKETIAQPHNDENKNIILFDDDNNQTILSTSNSDNQITLSQTQIFTTPKKFIDDECTPTKLANNDSDSNEMSTSQTETPLPDWIALNESGTTTITRKKKNTRLIAN